MARHVAFYKKLPCRVSEIQKWCGCPWATRISNFTCPPIILVAHHQQIFDEQQQVLKYLVAQWTTDVWQVLVHSCEAYVPGARTTNFRNPAMAMFVIKPIDMIEKLFQQW
jgi:hypothetical protein